MEISKIVLRRAIADLVEFNAFVQLLMQALAGSAVRRMEGCIVTISASSPAYLAVSIGAGETGIKNNLL